MSDPGEATAGLPGGSHFDAYQQQMEGSHSAGFTARSETLRGIEEVDRYGDAEGSDGAVKGNGSFRLTDAHRVCRGATAGGIRAD